jgi:hypothetical protein
MYPHHQKAATTSLNERSVDQFIHPFKRQLVPFSENKDAYLSQLLHDVAHDRSSRFENVGSLPKTKTSVSVRSLQATDTL